MAESPNSAADLRETPQSSTPGADYASQPAAAIAPEAKSHSPIARLRRFYDKITYTPKRCRHDPSKPPAFSMPLNLLFAFAGTFTVANLYYSHPILNLLADDFGVSDERASLIPTMAQAGYASGLLLLCPLGDVLPRRLFVLSLVLFTATAWFVLPSPNGQIFWTKVADTRRLTGLDSVSQILSLSFASSRISQV